MILYIFLGILLFVIISMIINSFILLSYFDRITLPSTIHKNYINIKIFYFYNYKYFLIYSILGYIIFPINREKIKQKRIDIHYLSKYQYYNQMFDFYNKNDLSIYDMFDSKEFDEYYESERYLKLIKIKKKS